MKDTLSTLDLNERSDQRVTWFHHLPHYQKDRPVYLVPGETSLFSSGPHHGAYSYTIESENDEQRNDLQRA